MLAAEYRGGTGRFVLVPPYLVANRPVHMETLVHPLDAALAGLRPRGAVLYRSELAAPWGFAVTAGPPTFHYVEAGRCLLTDPADGTRGPEGEGAPVVLDGGDLAVLPRGPAVAFRDAADSLAPPLADLLAQHPPEEPNTLRTHGTGPRTALVCAQVAFDDAVPHPVVEALPAVLVVRDGATGGPAAGARAPWLAQTLRHLAAEARSGLPGSPTVMAHLASVVFVHAVRAAAAAGCERVGGRPGWLGALADPQIGPALRAVQTDPSAPWTVETMAREAGLGRSAFAARFREAVGEPPMAYVARWRAHRAAGLLRDGATRAEAASAVGYESGAAFSRAFKRWTGLAPSDVR